MTLTLDLVPELESKLAAEAEQLHLSLAEYVLWVLEGGRVLPPAPDTGIRLIVNPPGEVPDVFAEARVRLGDNPPRTGAELIAYWEREGIIHSQPDDPPSPELARMLRERNQNRHHT
jgi:hypothetical protein